MERKVEEPLREALTFIQSVLDNVPDDETAWYLGEALKRIQEALGA